MDNINLVLGVTYTDSLSQMKSYLNESVLWNLHLHKYKYIGQPDGLCEGIYRYRGCQMSNWPFFSRLVRKSNFPRFVLTGGVPSARSDEMSGWLRDCRELMIRSWALRTSFNWAICLLVRRDCLLISPQIILNNCRSLSCLEMKNGPTDNQPEIYFHEPLKHPKSGHMAPY